MERLKQLFKSRDSEEDSPNLNLSTLLSGIADAGLLSSGYTSHFSKDADKRKQEMFNNLMDRQKTEDDLSTSALNREIAQTQENRAATKFGPQSEAERKLYTLKHPELNDFQDLSGDQAEAYDKTREAEQLRRDEMASRSHDRELQYATLANNKKTAADDKQTSKDDTDFKDIWLTAQGLKRGSSSGIYGLAMKNEAFSKDGLRIIDQIRSGKIKGNEAVASELAGNLYRTISGGGNTADSGISRLIPKSAWGSAQKIKEYITGHPQDFLTDSALNNLEQQFIGQKDYWGEAKNKSTNGLQILAEPLFDRDPSKKERWERFWSTPNQNPDDDTDSKLKRLKELRAKAAGGQ